jgi:glycosyltransferase involved in cell wall biosynthesis
MHLVIDCRNLCLAAPKGTENFALSLARGISCHIDRITVDVSPSDVSTAKLAFSSSPNVAIISDKVGAKRAKLMSADAPWLLRAIFFRLNRFLTAKGYSFFPPRSHWARKMEADLVFYPTHLSPPQYRIPAVTTVHGILRDYSKSQIETVSSHLQKSKVIVTSWPDPFNRLVASYPEQHHKIAMIPYAVEHSFASTPASVPPTLHLPGRYYFYPSVVLPRKNHEFLIRGAALLKATGFTPPCFVFTGGGDHALESSLKELVISLGLKDYFYFLGHVTSNEMSVLYENCRACLCASSSEAGIAVIQEGVSRKKPVICSHTPEARSHAAMYGLEVCYFGLDDPAQFADAVRTFENNHSIFLASAEKCSLLVRKVTLEYMVQCYADILRFGAGISGRPDWFPFRQP